MFCGLRYSSPAQVSPAEHGLFDTNTMSTQTKLFEILATTIKNDLALNGFSPSDLPEAAKARVAVCLYSGSLDREHSHEELEQLEKWSAKHYEKAVFEAREGE